MLNPIVFKLIILGQQGVGKSSMLIRYIKGQFSQQYNVTVGVQFATKDIIVQNNKITMQIWDTAGQQAFRAIVRSFYKGISGVFLAFGLDSQQSLQALKVWHKQVKQNSHEEVVFFMVGTKADLQQRQVSLEKAQQVLHELGALFFIQTSAKISLNIQQLFHKAGEFMYKKYKVSQIYRELGSPNKIKRGTLVPMGNSISMERKEKRCCGGKAQN